MAEDWNITVFQAAEIGYLPMLEDQLGKSTALVTNVEGKSLLHYAARGGHDHIIIKLAGDWGCNVDVADNDGNTPLHEAAKNGRAHTIHQLLEFKCDIQAVDEDQFTPLHTAAAYGQTDAMLALIERGADINAEAGLCGGPVHVAAMFGRVQVLESLAQQGFNLACKSGNGSTALHFAAFGGHIEAVVYLIKQGCNVNVKNEEDSTPLDYARMNGKHEAADALIAAGAEPGGGSTDLEQQSAQQEADATNVCEPLNSSDTVESSKGSPKRLRKIAKIGARGVILAADAAIEVGDTVCSLVASKLRKVKKKRETDETRSVNPSSPEQLLEPNHVTSTLQMADHTESGTTSQPSGSSKPAEVPMSAWKKNALIFLTGELKLNVMVKESGMLDMLAIPTPLGFFNQAEMQAIAAMANNRDRMDKIIEILLGKRDMCFSHFCDILMKSNNEVWADILRRKAEEFKRHYESRLVSSLERLSVSLPRIEAEGGSDETCRERRHIKH